MGKRNGKWIYLLIGVGCGMILSGILMVIIGLQSGQELTKLKNEYESKISILEAELKVYEKQQMDKITEQNVVEEVDEEVPEKQEEVVYVWVDIPHHYGAAQIARFLEEKKIIEDRDAFNQFILEQNATTKLRTGNKYLPKNGNYDEILSILLGKND